MRILILSGNTGEGHNSAARAMQEYFCARGCACRILDGLQFLSRPKNEFICKSHVFLYRKLPKVYGMGYRLEGVSGTAPALSEEAEREGRAHDPAQPAPP